MVAVAGIVWQNSQVYLDKFMFLLVTHVWIIVKFNVLNSGIQLTLFSVLHFMTVSVVLSAV